MTVNELIAALQALVEDGCGEYVVCSYDFIHGVGPVCKIHSVNKTDKEVWMR